MLPTSREPRRWPDSAVRNMLGYTGSYDGIPVSVMGTGMGIPSASIYATELITEYGVERLIRVGSCGGILASVKIRDVVLAIGACTDSGVNRIRYGDHDFAATADYWLLKAAEEKGLTIEAKLCLAEDLIPVLRKEGEAGFSRRIAEEITQMEPDVDSVLLSQFSMATFRR